MDEELKQYLEEFRAKFAHIDGQFQQMREGNAVEHAKTRLYVDVQLAETRREVKAEAEVTRRHFDSTVERFQSKFDLLGDGIKNIDEKLDREAADIRAEMRQGFADTHALIRFSQTQRSRRARR